jgi:hypothetical protein
MTDGTIYAREIYEMPASTLRADELKEIGDKIVEALNRNTAAQLTVAMMIERRNRDNTGNEIPDYIKDLIIGAFYSMQDSSQP